MQSTEGRQTKTVGLLGFALLGGADRYITVVGSKCPSIEFPFSPGQRGRGLRKATQFHTEIIFHENHYICISVLTAPSFFFNFEKRAARP